MIYRLLLIFSTFVFVFLSIAGICQGFSSGTMQVGTPRCEIYTEQSGVRCARVRCDATGVTLSSSDTCNPTRPADQYDLICENHGSCSLTDPLYCNSDQRSAEFGMECNGTITTVSSKQITCPVSCSCNLPQGQKPCRRATWNTSTCRWNDEVCYTGGGGGCLSGITVSGEKSDESTSADLCSPCNPTQQELDDCWLSGGTYDWTSCFCGASPIVIDMSGDGFNLTNSAGGVRFDINSDNFQEQVAWTSANSDDVWLALDRNGNGLIDDGTELFGNNTPQPTPPSNEQKNGFLALAVHDKTTNGGNNDGQIDSRDSIFSQLKLWQDTNKNGISETIELRNLSASPIRTIELDYHESRRTDEHGNRFRYRAKVKDAHGSQVGVWAWDVFLVTTR